MFFVILRKNVLTFYFQMHNELDKLFEGLKQAEKTTPMEPAEVYVGLIVKDTGHLC